MQKISENRAQELCLQSNSGYSRMAKQGSLRPIKVMKSRAKKLDVSTILDKINVNNVYSQDLGFTEMKLVGASIPSEASQNNNSPLSLEWQKVRNQEEACAKNKELGNFLQQKYAEHQKSLKVSMIQHIKENEIIHKNEPCDKPNDKSLLVVSQVKNNTEQARSLQKHRKLISQQKPQSNKDVKHNVVADTKLSSQHKHQSKSFLGSHKVNRSKYKHSSLSHLTSQIIKHSHEEDPNQKMKQQKEIQARYNGISLNRKTAEKDAPFTYILIRGNNSEMVKRVIESRQNTWTEVSSSTSIFNFKWSPFSRGIRYDFLTGHGKNKMVNHLEGHHNLTQKDTLFLNLLKYCEDSKLNVFDYMPLNFIVTSESGVFQGLDKFAQFHKIVNKYKGSGRTKDIEGKTHSHPLFQTNKYQTYTRYQMHETMLQKSNLWLIKPPDLN